MRKTAAVGPAMLHRDEQETLLMSFLLREITRSAQSTPDVREGRPMLDASTRLFRSPIVPIER
jgi:hypothetical protein